MRSNKFVGAAVFVGTSAILSGNISHNDNFQRQVLYSDFNPIKESRPIAIGDWNGDGQNDFVLFEGFPSLYFTLYLKDGERGFVRQADPLTSLPALIGDGATIVNPNDYVIASMNLLDMNSDGKVDLVVAFWARTGYNEFAGDMISMVLNNSPSPAIRNPDLNGDDKINAADLAILLSYWKN